MAKFLKISFSIILVITLLTSLISCGGDNTNDEELINEIKALYEKSLEINEYIYGNGLEHTVDPVELVDKKSPYYVSLDENAKYKTINELKDAVLEVYSTGYYSLAIENMLFTGYGDNNKLKAKYKEENGFILIDALCIKSDLSGRFDFSTAKVEKKSSNSVTIRADYIRDGKVNSYTLIVVKTENGWRFDTPSF